MIVGLILGAIFAAAIASGIPQYGRSLEIVSMHAAVEDVGPYNTSIHINSSWTPLSDEEHANADRAVSSAADSNLGELVIDSTRLTRSRLHWWGKIDDGLRTDSLASQAQFQFFENINDHVTYVEGVAPTDNASEIDGENVIEVSVFHDRAEMLQLSVGDVVLAQPVDRGAGFVRARISGTFEVTDKSEVFWLQLSSLYLEPGIVGREQPLIMIPTETGMFSDVAEANAGLPATYDWFLYTDQELMSDMTVSELESNLDDLSDDLEDTIARPFVITELIPRIESMKRRALFGSIPLLLMALMVLACVGFYLTMAAGLLGRRRVAGYMMLRSRGFTVKQQLRIHAAEALVISIPAAIIGPFISIGIIAAVGYLPTYKAITNGNAMPVELSATAWIWSLGAAIGAAAVMTAASSFWDKSTLAASRSADAHAISAPWFQRYYLDALLISLSAIVWWEVSSRNSVVLSEGEGDFSPDLTLLAAPILIVVSASLVALRLFPIITRVLAGIGLRSNSTALGLGLASVARRPFFHGWPMLVFALAISTGVVAGSVVSTLQRSTNEQVLYSTGADFHVVTTGSTGQVEREQLAEVGEISPIDVVTPALRTESTVGTTSIGTAFGLFAIDPIDFQRVAWFRDDFSDSETPITQLVDRLAVRITPEAIKLPPSTTGISIWANTDPVTPNHELWIVISDGLGDNHTINLGQFEEGWFIASANLAKFIEPIEVISIQTSLKVGPDSAPTAEFLIDDLVATTADGTKHLVLDFDLPGLWKGLPTAEGEDTGFVIAIEPDGLSGNVPGDDGEGIGRISLGRGSTQGVRGIYRSAIDRPIPLIANDLFMGATGVGLHRPFMIDVQGGLVPVEVIDQISYFPTIDPERGPFVVADLGAIVDFVELRGRKKVTPNELFASLKPSEDRTDEMRDAEIAESIRDVFRLARIRSRADLMNNSFVDPVAVAGWRGMSVVATIVASLIVLMAYVIFLAAYSLRTKGDSALILALGASSRDHWIITIFELLPAILIGTLVGVGTGFIVSTLMVGSMAHTGTGEQLLPPFVVQTNWILPVVTIAAIFTIVLAGVLNSVRSFNKIKIARMAREGFSAAST
jgi:hypothetical protein